MSRAERNNNNADASKTLRGLSTKLASATFLYPFYYGRTLMQLGHEPWPPDEGHTVWGNHVLRLPNLIQYVSHIGREKGFFGCFHGLTPCFAEYFATSYVQHRLSIALGPPSAVFENKAADEITNEDYDAYFQETLKRDLKMYFCSVVAAQPFHVITIRMISQFMSADRKYLGVFETIREIYQLDGLFGFYNGLIPRLINGASCMILIRYIMLQFRKHILSDGFSHIIGEFLVTSFIESIFYPFRLVGVCMAANSRGHTDSAYPTLPYLSSSLDCWRDLQALRQLHRGESIFFRTLNEKQLTASKERKGNRR